MFFRQLVPNFITSLNVACGCMGIIFALNQQLLWASWMIGIAAVLDFMDGLAARLLRGQSELGKQLDSLADVITFGVLPGIILFQFITIGFNEFFVPLAERPLNHVLIAATGFLVPIFSALRLARFNISENESVTFQGLPTPANALFFASFALILDFQHDLNFYFPPRGDTYTTIALTFGWDTFDAFVINTLLNPWFHVVAAVISSALLVSKIPMFSFKFKNFRWRENKIRYFYLIIIGLGLIAVFFPYWDFQAIGLDLRIRRYPDIDFVIIPILLLLYPLLSIVNSLLGLTKDT